MTNIIKLKSTFFYLFLFNIFIFNIRLSAVCSVAQLCPTLCDLMDYSPPGSSVHGIFQARIQASGFLFPSPGNLPDQGLNSRLLCLLPWQADSLSLCHLGSPLIHNI